MVLISGYEPCQAEAREQTYFILLEQVVKPCSQESQQLQDDLGRVTGHVGIRHFDPSFIAELFYRSYQQPC